MKTLETLFQTRMLTEGIRETYNANNLFGPGIARALSDRLQTHDENAKPQQQISQLTTREREVLQLVAEGKANKEMASELCISIKTVEKHRGNIMEKLGIRGTARLTHYAIAAGVIPCNP